MPRIVCMGCDKEIGMAEVPFCNECAALIDPDMAIDRELTHALGHLKGAKEHITNSAGACVSWCPACRASAR